MQINEERAMEMREYADNSKTEIQKAIINIYRSVRKTKITVNCFA